MRVCHRSSPIVESTISGALSDLGISDDFMKKVADTGKLTKESYEELAPAVDARIQEHGKIRILFEMPDFHGWTAGAMWEDLKKADLILCQAENEGLHLRTEVAAYAKRQRLQYRSNKTDPNSAKTILTTFPLRPV